MDLFIGIMSMGKCVFPHDLCNENVQFHMSNEAFGSNLDKLSLHSKQVS